jgi:DNA-directed RNA polymerase subunit N (RpoN/RPB10)
MIEENSRCFALGKTTANKSSEFHNRVDEASKVLFAPQMLNTTPSIT